MQSLQPCTTETTEKTKLFPDILILIREKKMKYHNISSAFINDTSSSISKETKMSRNTTIISLGAATAAIFLVLMVYILYKVCKSENVDVVETIVEQVPSSNSIPQTGTMGLEASLGESCGQKPRDDSKEQIESFELSPVHEVRSPSRVDFEVLDNETAL